MNVCVVDVSALIPLVVDQPATEKAEYLVAQTEATPPLRLLSPDVVYAECANALWRYVRHAGHDGATALLQLARIRALPIRVTSTLDLVEDALKLAILYGMSAYDACYVALAQRESCLLVTNDRPLVRHLAGGPVEVQSLEDL